MRPHAWDAVRAGRADLEGLVPPEAHLPQGSGGPVAERGLRTAGQHSGHRTRLMRGRSVAHGVHPSMNEQEPTALDAVVDARGCEPGAAQLRAGDHAVLRGGEGGDRRVLT